MSILALWFASGIVFSALCRKTLHLSFKPEPLTVGSILSFIIGSCLPPLSALGAVTWFCCWAFSNWDHQNDSYAKWSENWTKMRYRQHCTWRRMWHLGKMPKEDIFSGWQRYRPDNH